MLPEKENKSSGSIQIAQFTSGPLPHPQILAGYEQVLHGAADRILQMAENEQKHQHQRENAQTHEVSKILFVGQIGSTIVALTAICFSFILLLHDKNIAGFVTLFSTIATFLGVYFHKIKSNGKDSKP